AIGSRNLLKSIAKQREAQQQQLRALIAEKKTQLERCQVMESRIGAIFEDGTREAAKVHTTTVVGPNDNLLGKTARAQGRHGRGLTRINRKGRDGGDRNGNTREKSGGRGCLRRDSAPSTTSVTPGGNETTDGDTVVTPLPAPAEGGAARLRRLRRGEAEAGTEAPTSTTIFSFTGPSTPGAASEEGSPTGAAFSRSAPGGPVLGG
ncbi:Intraflagellar transport protein 20-like protein A, partial [Acropora cervicornis]